MKNEKCKICRRLGMKLFLKGERCLSQKCPIVRRSYPPGIRGKRRGKRRLVPLSEYGKELGEKQKLREWYNLKERQFKKYVKEVMEKRGRVEDIGELLIEKLERRLDNVIFRLGLASSRIQARQLVSHSHFLVNGRVINIPSYQLKKGDKIRLCPSSLKKTIFRNLILTLKKHKPPSWLKLDAEKIEGEIIGKPSIAEAAPPAEISAIFEFYSR